jgi:2-dehydro-3-deoxygalactonokinase
VSTSDTRLIGLDWGTTSLRAHRLGESGAVLETRHLARGIMHVTRAAGADSESGFEQAFAQACGDWIGACPNVPVIACGMVGSAQGWREVSYLDVPVSLDRLAAALTRVNAANGVVVHIVPGLIERGRLPNVMRGEETQIVGALAEPSAPHAADGVTLVGLPGTHSKWARVADHQLLHFDTFMTGEVYEALCTHTLLGRTLERVPDWDRAAFDRGALIARSTEGRAGVLSTIFSTRTLGLTGVLSATAQADHLSGLLIGHEIQALEDMDRHVFDGANRTVLVGDDRLCERYRRVLAACGQSANVAIAQHATERGLWALARAAGLVTAESHEPQHGSQHDTHDRAQRPLQRALSRCGLVAILRGIQPREAGDIGAALYAAGFRAIEVPLNSPEPLESIRSLRQALGNDCVVGAGTVLTLAQIDEVRRAGAGFVVMPHTNLGLIRAAKAAGLEVAPGAATISEALAALSAGADAIKLFPADQLGAPTLAAWNAVLPAGTPVIPVGGITPDNMLAFVAAGAVGFGLGSALYRPGRSATDVAQSAAAFVAAWQAARAKRSEPARSRG